LIILGMYSRLI